MSSRELPLSQVRRCGKGRLWMSAQPTRDVPMIHGPDVKAHVAGDVTIRHVLCPVDLSGAAAKALKYATALSSALGGELTVLYVDPVTTGRPQREESREITAFIAATVGPATDVRPIQ